MFYQLFLHTSVTPSNLKLGVEVPKASEKLSHKLRQGGNGKLEFRKKI